MNIQEAAAADAVGQGAASGLPLLIGHRSQALLVPARPGDLAVRQMHRLPRIR